MIVEIGCNFQGLFSRSNVVQRCYFFVKVLTTCLWSSVRLWEPFLGQSVWFLWYKLQLSWHQFRKRNCLQQAMSHLEAPKSASTFGLPPGGKMARRTPVCDIFGDIVGQQQIASRNTYSFLLFIFNGQILHFIRQASFCISASKSWALCCSFHEPQIPPKEQHLTSSRLRTSD